MCGIVGIVSKNKLDSTYKNTVKKMNDKLIHRGPDEEGYFYNENICFAQKRLSIIDLSVKGRQPMTNEDESLIMVCNGEIYNYPELKKKLLKKNHKFKSNTDVEVILHLYEEYKEKCVKHLVGMFAFAIWNIKEKKLLICRDRIGEKPLFYTTLNNNFYFASEIKSLLEIQGIKKEINLEAVYNLLSYPTPPKNITFFKNIYQLPLASKLIWKDNNIFIEKYWQINFKKLNNKIKLNDAIKEYNRLFTQSVKGCCLADVPVGVTLSGGLDSSSITVFASEFRDDIYTFTVGNNENDPEFLRANTVAENCKTNHQNIKFSADKIELLPEIIYHYDEPFNLFPMIYSYQLAKEISKKVKVVLGGNGADEIFAGYKGYNTQKIISDIFGILKYTPDFFQNFHPSFNIYKNAAKLELEKRRGYIINEQSRKIANLFLTENLIKKYDDYSPGLNMNNYIEDCNPRDYLDTVLYSDLMMYHQHSTTKIADISGMSQSLEIRAPFLDYRLIEFGYSLPKQFLIPSVFYPNLNKLIMKKSLENKLPKDLLYAKKMGFGYSISLKELVENKWKHIIDKYVLNGDYLNLNIFDKNKVAHAVNQNPYNAWMLLVFSIWYEMYFNEKKIGNILVKGGSNGL